MPAYAHDDFSDRMPTEIEVESAEQLRKILVSGIDSNAPTKLNLAFQKGEMAEVTLTPSLAYTFLEILRYVSSGKGFKIIPVGAELTTQQAADHLNVSRPFLIKLLESGDIPFSNVGRHRRIKAKDLFAYKAERDRMRQDSLSEMAKLDAEKGYI
ncbi:putative antitoxin VapB50 (plasmid) [Maritalea myrionectae]|uniref:Putative antitoxin VapB50 n=1 Tax=Maritalea myrionectae TaxID=454601 RepID=A0A2R4MIX4_9HYPH|nr:helix-turn-helix domain-containing protein [Maritalea myrionectae]AVX05967.1 putative antitoxin VapB50 [Maritalea myrionectae]